jgi:hypothetical protein
MNNEKLFLVGCGILKNEVNYLIKKNAWPLDTVFFDSSLHIDFEQLSNKLTSSLAKFSNRKVIVFYGSCHPLMDKILHDAKTIRTPGQNCVEMLLGEQLFTKELSNGAFFLLEDWALRWNFITKKTFGTNKTVIRDIFKGDRKYLLALRTPCSQDFTEKAEMAAQYVDLPLKWMDVSLDHLELVLQTAITEKLIEAT